MENNESQKFVSFRDATIKLGQMQYVSRFINPDQRLHEDGIPYFSDIRIEGDPDDYYNLRIHPDDVKKFIEKWLEYKQSTTSLFFTGKKLEDFL